MPTTKNIHTAERDQHTHSAKAYTTYTRHNDNNTNTYKSHIAYNNNITTTTPPPTATNNSTNNYHQCGNNRQKEAEALDNLPLNHPHNNIMACRSSSAAPDIIASLPVHHPS
jgi:hypothetical protein